MKHSLVKEYPQQYEATLAEHRPMLGGKWYDGPWEFTLTLEGGHHFMKDRRCGTWVGEAHMCHVCNPGECGCRRDRNLSN